MRERQFKKFFIVYGHYDDNSFNAAIRDTFIESAKKAGHTVDMVDLYKEKFDPVFAGGNPGPDVLDHRRRIEQSDTIVLIAPIWNFRMPAILEGWIDKVLAPPWAQGGANTLSIHPSRIAGILKFQIGAIKTIVSLCSMRLRWSKTSGPGLPPAKTGSNFSLYKSTISTV